VIYRGFRGIKTLNRKWFIPALGFAGIYTTSAEAIEAIDQGIRTGALRRSEYGLPGQ